MVIDTDKVVHVYKTSARDTSIVYVSIRPFDVFNLFV